MRITNICVAINGDILMDVTWSDGTETIELLWDYNIIGEC